MPQRVSTLFRCTSWAATIGIVLYIAAMWIAGVLQGPDVACCEPDGTSGFCTRRREGNCHPSVVAGLYLGGMVAMRGMPS